MGKVYDKLQRYHPNQRNHLSQNMGKHPLHLCSWFMWNKVLNTVKVVHCSHYARLFIFVHASSLS